MAVKIGFIGVGGMAEHHIKKLVSVEEAKITAVFDINQERSRQIAEQYGATSYDSSDQLMDSGEVEAIFVCTPPFAREGIEEAAAKRGIHLLVEKPVGLQMEKVLHKERLIRESGIVHSSGYCLRYLDIATQAKAYLADKQIDLILAHRLGGMPGVRWWRMLEQSGGQLVEQSTHQLDLVRYVAGDFKEVHAYHAFRAMKQIDPEATAYDSGTVSFVMESGAIGNITSTSLAKYAGRGDIEFFGRDFYMSLSPSTLRIKDDHQDTTVKSDVDYYLEQDKAFLEAIRTGRRERVLCDYSEAAKTLAVTLAANLSAETGKPITVASMMDV